MNDIDRDITVGELIRKVSDELLESREERILAGQPPVFEVDTMDIEISFVVTASKSGSGGIDLKVLRGDLSKSYEDQAVQRVVVHLKATSLKPGEHEFEDFDASTPLRPRRRFDDEKSKQL